MCMKCYWPFGFIKQGNGLLLDESSCSLTLDPSMCLGFCSLANLWVGQNSGGPSSCKFYF